MIFFIQNKGGSATVSHPVVNYTNYQCRSKGNISGGGGGGARERRRREPLGGSGGMLPQKILKCRGLEMLFPAFSKSTHIANYLYNNNNKANILRGSLQSPNGGFQEGPLENKG